MATTSTSKASSGDRAVTHPRRYWPIVLIAVAMAESAHAPLVGRNGAVASTASSATKASGNPKHAKQALGVREDHSIKPLAFLDNSSKTDPRKNRDRDWPLEIDPRVTAPVTLISAPKDSTPILADGTVLSPSSGSSGPADISPFISLSPFDPENVVPATQGHAGTVETGPQSAVPEPSSMGAVMVFGWMLSRRRGTASARPICS